MSRRLLAAAGVLAGLALAPASAPAALVAVIDDATATEVTMVYRAGAGEVSSLLVEETGTGRVRLTRITTGVQPDTDELVPVGPGCEADETTPADDVECTGVERVDARLGDGDDALLARVGGPPPQDGLLTIPLLVAAGPGDDTVTGGADADTILGDDGADILLGANGEDLVDGGAGDDPVVGGGDGADELLGGAGDDRLDGDESGATGAADGGDRLDGGPGSDRLVGDGGGDVLAGGDDFDTVSYDVRPAPAGLAVTLNGAADDGATGEGDDVRPDVEDVEAGDGDDTVTGDAGPNVLTGLRGDDTLDGADGEDRVDAGDGDDLVRARDGFADRVSCGAGSDRAVLDALDVVSDDCEAVDRVGVPARRDVPEDRPPTVAFLAPAADAFLAPGPVTLVAAAGDDRGVARVEFLDDGRVVATDERAPYQAVYRPRTEDVGRNTLAVRAVDTSGQTTTDLRPVRVDRFAPGALSARVTPTIDRRAPLRFLTIGRLARPVAVSFDDTCRGTVSVQIKAGSRTLSSRRARVRRDCSFISNVTFASRVRFGGRRSLRITARFVGNAVLGPGGPVTRTVRVPRAPRRRS